MGRPTKLTLLAIGLAISMAAARPTLAADSDPVRRAKAVRVSQQELLLKINQLQEQNRTLEIQNRAIQQQLSTQQQEIDGLVHQMQVTVQPVANLQQQVPQMQQQLSDVAKKQRSVPLEVGFRTGWSESPYGMPGGMYYAAFLNHRLLTHEDGVPGGFISGEMLVGWTQGNHANTPANLTGYPSSSWLDTLSLQPTLQYHLDPALLGMEQLAAFKPYVLGGPAMYISMMSTPDVAGKGNSGAGYRHYDADPQGGGVWGAGFELGLSALKLPPIQGLLDKSFIGGEWRFDQYANGQGYNQYTGSISFGW